MKKIFSKSFFEIKNNFEKNASTTFKKISEYCKSSKVPF